LIGPRGSAVVPQSASMHSDTLVKQKFMIGHMMIAGTAGWIRTTDLLIHSQAL
jgi:hypothetical protein